ncbi:tyrosine-type recombinase/integrase [Actinomycetospora straminea]|uniref:Site-specific integrase n=1 Tax=Actinomycetospora straminea TaxID=663607 RepID=A0ABP9DX50_9PSEU|nr:tyrosine-type recombinase/integrase [Actinomycetospora straminea]MDD7934180.1 tyrosine-type recombinase/integrase [Actinomycetospora straminea]
MSIHRTPEGTYRAKWRDPSNRQRSKNFTTRREAKTFLAEQETAKARGQYVDPQAGRLRFAVHAQAWLDSRNSEATTQARDASIMRTHVLPQWEHWQLAKIDHLSVQRWVTQLAGRRSPATVAEAYRLTSSVLRSAVRNRLIAFNPCEEVRLPQRRKHDHDDRVIAKEDLSELLLPAVPERYRAFVATAAWAGLRWGEIAGLRMDALDLHRRRLRVVRVVVEVSGTTAFKPYPKSGAGRRTVPLPEWLTTMIGDHTARFGVGDHGLVFPNAVGKPLRRTLFRSRVWRPALVRAGLLGQVAEIDGHKFEAHWTDEDGESVVQVCGSYDEAVKVAAREAGAALRFHDLRHSYATWLVDDGVPPNMVQRVMGHENVTTTLQLYTRRTEHHDRILDALGGGQAPAREDDEDGPDDDDEDGPAGSLAIIK